MHAHLGWSVTIDGAKIEMVNAIPFPMMVLLGGEILIRSNSRWTETLYLHATFTRLSRVGL